MHDRFVVIKRAALSGVRSHEGRAEAEAAAAADVVKDGEPRLIVQVHNVVARRVSAELLPANAEVSGG